MENEDKLELVKKSELSNIQEHLKDSFGIEFFVNELLPVELETQGYQKMSLDEFRYVEPLFKIAPQLIVDKINGEAIEKAFKAATENSYKCLLDPSMHLATIKGSSDVFLGSGLDNITNKVSGQARWLENDVVLSISNAPNIALNAFNALSAVTGQYFMAQVNAKLSVIKNEIDDIKQYIDDIKQSELEAALQELNEIIRHIQFIKKNPERTRSTIIQIEEVRKVARRNINLYSNQIQKVKKRASKTDSENSIKQNTDDLMQYIIQYRYAVYVYNLAQILKIYLNDITDVEELSMFRDEISMTVNSYKDQYDKMLLWVNRYLEETNSLNKMNIKQLLLMTGSGVFVGILSRNIIAGRQTASQVNNLLEDNRKKKKEAYIARNDEYQTQMNDMDLIDSSISAIDKYIEFIGKKVEIVAVEGEYFIKYINDES